MLNRACSLLRATVLRDNDGCIVFVNNGEGHLKTDSGHFQIGKMAIKPRMFLQDRAFRV